MADESSQALKQGYQIDNYRILRKIGGGGFSIVYLADDISNNAKVVIKEFIPRKLAIRASDGVTVQTRGNISEKEQEQFNHGRKLFFQEANFLSTLKHPNIVNVVNFFRENGTVYMVMAYEKGITLQDYIYRHKGGLSEKFIKTVFFPLLDGLSLIHERGLLHLDIKPGNIYLREKASPILLDFGAAHEMKNTRQYQPGQVLTMGFSPYEQSISGGYVGPWSDLYAIGATMRSCIDSEAPPSAADRRMKDKMKPATEAFKRRYSRGLLSAIDWAMEVDPMLRPQNVAEYIEGLQREYPEEPPTLAESVMDKLTKHLSWRR
jgi:serine/threonine protein kinase